MALPETFCLGYGEIMLSQLTPAALLFVAFLILTPAVGLAESQTSELTVDSPFFNAVVAEREVVIQGSAPPHSVVRHGRRFKSDPKIHADAAGIWQYPVKLKDGGNTYSFHVEGEGKVKARVVVFYNPEGPEALSVLEPLGLPTTTTKEFLIAGKAKPGDTVYHERKWKKDTKIPVDATGRWEYRVSLKEGDNNFSFHLGSSDSTKAGATVRFDPDAQVAFGAVESPAPTATQTPTPPLPTKTPTARPSPTSTATPTPVPPSSTPTPNAQPTGRVTALVTRVIDGDTIELEGGARVRLIGVDTPETVAPGQPVDCYGPEASSYTKQLVEGQTVYLEKDVSETDRYDRLLRYVYLATGEMVNELLLANGYAQVSTYPPDVKYQERFLAVQQQAVAAGAGLWSGCTESKPTATTAPVVQPTVTTAPVQPTEASGANCHPSYHGGTDRDRGGCIQQGIGDYDCWPGQGNGPNYAIGPVTVVGPDEFQLDNNDPDNIGCEGG